jgi:hypothetical protein
MKDEGCVIADCRVYLFDKRPVIIAIILNWLLPASTDWREYSIELLIIDKFYLPTLGATLP